jgi:hypothetical protein
VRSTEREEHIQKYKRQTGLVCGGGGGMSRVLASVCVFARGFEFSFLFSVGCVCVWHEGRGDICLRRQSLYMSVKV